MTYSHADLRSMHHAPQTNETSLGYARHKMRIRM